jgi:hypothetical protein
MPRQTHTKVVLLGVIGPKATPWEIWSMSLSLDAGDFGLSEDQRNAVTAAVSDYFVRANTQISNYVHLQEVAFSLVGTDGKQIGETVRVPQDRSGLGGSMSMPPQVALRVSLGSGLRGRSQKGGFYLPVPAIGISADTGQISQEAADLALSSTVSMIDQVNAVPGVRVVIASSVAGNVPVQLVRVGRRLDVIRRRANAIPESYVAESVG